MSQAKAGQIKQAREQGQKAWARVWDGLTWEHEEVCPYQPKTDRLLYAAWRIGFEENRAA